MSGRKVGEYSIAIVFTIVVLAACIWAWCYGQSLPDELAVQRFSAIATAVAAVGGIFAALALVIYTIETRLLRIASEEQFNESKEQFEKQLEGSIMPVVLLEIVSEGALGDKPSRLTTRQFRNVGTGPAFHVKVDPINGEAGDILNIEEVLLILPKETVPAACSYEGNILDGQSGDESSVARIFATHTFQSKTPVTVRCTGLSQKRYSFLHRIRLAKNSTKYSTEFVAIEQG